MDHIVIGIEGHVGAGKTSICRELLTRMKDTVLLNGGNLYRAIVYAMMQSGKTLQELKKNIEKVDIKEMMDFFQIQMKIENNETIMYMKGQKLDEELLQSQNASIAVSTLGGSAKNQNLFIFARHLIDQLRQTHHVILSARGVMEIYPDCNYHFFITADLEERVRRKCIQYHGASYDEVKSNIIKRDQLQEEAGFYRLNKMTDIIDVTECKSVSESTEKVMQYMKEFEMA